MALPKKKVTKPKTKVEQPKRNVGRPKKVKEEQPKRKVGRPKKVIDYESVEKLAMLMCTEEEIANYLGISARTLQKDEEFLRIYKKGLDFGKMSLRRTQFKLAQKSSAMAIFLGKQYLGQSDDFSNITKLKQDEQDALSIAFEEFTQNGTITDNDQ